MSGESNADLVRKNESLTRRNEALENDKRLHRESIDQQTTDKVALAAGAFFGGIFQFAGAGLGMLNGTPYLGATAGAGLYELVSGALTGDETGLMSKRSFALSTLANLTVYAALSIGALSSRHGSREMGVLVENNNGDGTPYILQEDGSYTSLEQVQKSDLENLEKRSLIMENKTKLEFKTFLENQKKQENRILNSVDNQ